MKKFFLFFLAMVLFAGPALADDVNVRVNNTNTNNATATGGNAWQNQDQRQVQGQIQGQTAIGQGGAGGNVSNSGNSSVSNSGNSSLTVNQVREHTGSLQGVMGGFVAAPFAPPDKGWEQIRCDFVYRYFTIDALNNMAAAGRWLDKRGSFFDAMFDIKVKEVIRISYMGNDTRPIRILDVVPANAQVLGVIEGIGDYGWPLDEVLAKTLLRAKQLTGTVNVVVYKTTEIDAKNSGLSAGFGASGAASPTADTSGAGSLGAMVGNTYSEKRFFYKVKVIAFSEVPAGPDVCSPPQTVLTPPPPPPAPPKVEKPVPPPTPVLLVCSQKEIAELYARLERNRIDIYGDGENKGCDIYSLNNLRLRLERGNLFLALFECTGDREALKAAIENYEIAARNYKFGSDIKKHQSDADQMIASVYTNWQKAKKALESLNK